MGGVHGVRRQFPGYGEAEPPLVFLRGEHLNNRRWPAEGGRYPHQSQDSGIKPLLHKERDHPEALRARSYAEADYFGT
jgi:hypothetical protein